MRDKYIFRAGLEWNSEYYGEYKPIPPTNLPVEIGPFHIDISPNNSYYMVRMGWDTGYSGDVDCDVPPEQDYPNSILYVETTIEVIGKEDEEAKADETFDKLESMFRLFQAGDVLLRRNLTIGMKLGGSELFWACYLDSRPIRHKVKPLFQLPPYNLDNKTIREFTTFFYEYWDIINQKHRPIYHALIHFTSSYERRTNNERLLELMIAMEALFGDQDYQRYKIPLRFSCMLFPPGEARKNAFTTIKELYDARSEIVHSGKLELKTSIEMKITQFEEYVRMSIKRFLELEKSGFAVATGPELDELLFFNQTLWP